MNYYFLYKCVYICGFLLRFLYNNISFVDIIICIGINEWINDEKKI